MSTAKRARPAARRRRPRQERSEATVEAALEAAAREFATEGYEGATTNRIAAAAGISVGSLYQYFPSKEAIAVELTRRFRAERIATIRTRLEGLGEEPVEPVVRVLFASFLKAEGIKPELYRVLIEQVIRSPRGRQELRGYEEKLEALVAEALRRIRPPPAIDDLDMAAFMLVRLVLALVHSAAADRQRYNTPALARELTRLVVAYLAPGEAAQPRK